MVLVKEHEVDNRNVLFPNSGHISPINLKLRHCTESAGNFHGSNDIELFFITNL